MGTFSKAIPSVGGYVAGSKKLCDFLCHQARGFIYSGALPPSAAAAALVSLDIIERESDRVQMLHDNTIVFSSLLRSKGFSFLNSQTPIFPIMCRDLWKALQLARLCQRRGVFIQAIGHPVVPKGLERLRAVVTAAHSRDDLEFCASVLHQGALEIGSILAESHT